MSGIRTMAAAELLGVTPAILRGWEDRFGYPKPRRSSGGHRQYDLAELVSVRRALLETHNVASAIELARRRGSWPSSPKRLVDAFDHFDEGAADRVMEESLAVRSVERSVEEVLIPAVETAAGRPNREAEFQLARRWAAGWLFAAFRAVPHASRTRTVLLFDSSSRAAVDSLRVQAIQLGLRRAGICAVVLPFDLPPHRVLRAVRALDPVAFVFCGGEVSPEAALRLTAAIRQAGSSAPLFDHGESLRLAQEHDLRTLGSTIVEAVGRLKAYMESRGEKLPGASAPVHVGSGRRSRRPQRRGAALPAAFSVAVR
jgi:MerR family transcriptional regulator, light-induced transcriptional regulator